MDKVLGTIKSRKMLDHYTLFIQTLILLSYKFITNQLLVLNLIFIDQNT